ncbi:glucose-6-phosphate isomerase family protein [Rubrobacter xylanophilus]|uniref:glucose-6-phosphate isomerase family protein n=1 Tax=Rubrobacter xylanophilus TaxID=49319 RepID=UPI001C63EF9D|nr:glucose-6-phosphate isomerase family protein [Rubrobacter xylanophilus]
MKRETMEPFGAVFDLAQGYVEPTGVVSETRISDMGGLYADEAARERLERDDPLVYRVVGAPVPEKAGEVPFSITTIESGVVGQEFFMTKGHTHLRFEGEIYFGLSGEGLLLLYDGEKAHWISIGPGKAGYIPPGWAHRTVNVGSEPLRFLAVYPGAAGHDYDFVRKNGMGVRVMTSADGYRVVRDSAARSEDSKK